MAVKVCPNCSYEECFAKATTCEKCGYKFGTKITKPRPVKVKLEEVDEPVKSEPLVIPKPKKVIPQKIESDRTPLVTNDPAQLDPNWNVFSSLSWLHDYKAEDSLSLDDWIKKTTTEFKNQFDIHLAFYSLSRLAKLSPNPALQSSYDTLVKFYPQPKVIEGIFHFLGMFTGDADKEPARLLKNPVVRALVIEAQAKIV